MSSSKVAAVTGASSGIGAALARELHRRGYGVALMARRKERLDAIASDLAAHGPAARAYDADVDVEGSVEAALGQAHRDFGRLDVVVANAGISVAGSVEQLSISDYRRQIETNVFGVLRTVKAAIPFLRETRGQLGVVGSVMGYISLPRQSAYAMSKYAVRALCEALEHELAPEGIGVTHIAPGFVESEIRHKNNAGVLREGSKDPAPRWLKATAEEAAVEIANALAKRRREVVVTGHAKVATFIARHGSPAIHAAVGWARPLVKRFDKDF